MEYKKVHDFIPFIEDIYLVSEYGDIYLKVKSYNGSYKCTVYDENNQSHSKCITELVKSLKNVSFKEIDKNLVLYDGEFYSRRRIKGDRYKGFKFYKNGHEKRVSLGVHKVVDCCFNNGPLKNDTHHIDRNKFNNHYTNLLNISHAEHLKLHKKDKSDGKYLLKYEEVEVLGVTYYNTSVRDIAKILSISNSTLFYHIKTGEYKGYPVRVKESATTIETVSI